MRAAAVVPAPPPLSVDGNFVVVVWPPPVEAVDDVDIAYLRTRSHLLSWSSSPSRRTHLVGSRSWEVRYDAASGGPSGRDWAKSWPSSSRAIWRSSERSLHRDTRQPRSGNTAKQSCARFVTNCNQKINVNIFFKIFLLKGDKEKGGRTLLLKQRRKAPLIKNQRGVNPKAGMRISSHERSKRSPSIAASRFDNGPSSTKWVVAVCNSEASFAIG